MNEKKFDVIVIGAGIIGLCVSYYLVEKNLKVFIIDKEYINSGTSGSCNGNIIIGNRNPDLLTELVLNSFREYKKLKRILSSDFEFKQKGSLLLFDKNFSLYNIAPILEQQKKLDIKFEYFSKKYIKDNLNISYPRIAGGLLCKIDSSINPLYFNLALKNMIEERNGKFAFYEEVRQIQKKESLFCIKTEKDNYFSNFLVNCAGYHSPLISNMIDEDIPITLNRGCILVTEAIPKVLPFTILDWKDIEYDISKSAGEKSKNDKKSINFVAEQTSSGNILIGKSEEINSDYANISIEILKKIARKALIYLPFLNNVKIIRSYTGYRPQTPDNNPIIGESIKNENFYYATGHGGYGISLAPITGKIISQLICKSKIDFDITSFSPRRFLRKEAIC